MMKRQQKLEDVENYGGGSEVELAAMCAADSSAPAMTSGDPPSINQVSKCVSVDTSQADDLSES